MGFHHVAVATRDLPATHRFYTEAMGFRLVKVIAAPNPEIRDGEVPWSRHVFYDTGNGEMFAVWDIHDSALGEFDPAIATGLGLPVWSNHIAFHAATLDDLAACRDRWLAHDIDVLEVDHGWCTSIYTLDPNGIMVEWCVSTQEFTDADTEEAHRLLAAEQPELESGKAPKVYKAAEFAGASAGD
jgi:catechol 2,3-dioxygenase-like lactoylglutathione lyase family enzyme